MTVLSMDAFLITPCNSFDVLCIIRLANKNKFAMEEISLRCQMMINHCKPLQLNRHTIILFSTFLSPSLSVQI